MVQNKHNRVDIVVVVYHSIVVGAGMCSPWYLLLLLVTGICRKCTKILSTVAT